MSIYVYPEGPKLKSSAKGFVEKKVYTQLNSSPRLSVQEVRDTFKERMDWTDCETAGLIGGAHTLGRTHGNRNLAPNGPSSLTTSSNDVGPFFEAQAGSLRGPDDGTSGKEAAFGAENTGSSGFEGHWARTPSQWNYDFP